MKLVQAKSLIDCWKYFWFLNMSTAYPTPLIHFLVNGNNEVPDTIEYKKEFLTEVF